MKTKYKMSALIPKPMGFIRSSCLTESRTASDKSIQESKHLKLESLQGVSFFNTYFTDKGSKRKRFGQSAPWRWKVFPGPYNHCISSKPKTITASKSGQSSRPIFAVLNPEYQDVVDSSRLSQSLLPNEISGASRADCWDIVDTRNISQVPQKMQHIAWIGGKRTVSGQMVKE